MLFSNKRENCSLTYVRYGLAFEIVFSCLLAQRGDLLLSDKIKVSIVLTFYKLLMKFSSSLFKLSSWAGVAAATAGGGFGRPVNAPATR